MKTTLEIPDDLFRAAKAKAALEGTKLKDLVAEGLRIVVHGAGSNVPRRRIQFPLIRSGQPGSMNLAGADIARLESDIELGTDAK